MSEIRLDRPAWARVIFVADEFDDDASTLPYELRTDLEKSDPGLIADVAQAITALGLDHIHVQSPAELIDALGVANDQVVFSTYGGERSRNRLLLVPAIAEALGAPYVGLDAVGHALAADKMVSKHLASECGFKTPLARLIREAGALSLCDEFPAPYVVKPVAEGSSIGIGPQSLIHEPSQGRAIAADLLERFGQPVMIEEFIGGKEASILCLEGSAEIHMAFVEVAVAGDPDYFERNLFVADEKLHRRQPRSVRTIPAALGEGVQGAVAKLLRAIGHFGYCRIDGKWRDNEFYFLELTPDAWLGPEGQLAAGFRDLGWSYEKLIAAILQSASLRPRAPLASG